MTGGCIAGIVGVVVIVVAILLVMAYWLSDQPTYGKPPAALTLGAGLLSLTVVMLAWWWAMAFTLSGDYHAWNEKSGTVQAVSSRLVSTSDNDGPSQRFVVRLNGVPYGIDDTRASLLKVGDYVKLKCKKDYEWGTPREAQGWACKWGGGTPVVAS